MLWSAAPLPSPMRAARAPTRTLSRRGREKPWAHAIARPEPICLDELHISRFQRGARLPLRKKKGGTLHQASRQPSPLAGGLEVHPRRQPNLPRIAVETGQHASPAKRRIDARCAVQVDELAGKGVLAKEVVPRHDILLVREILAVDAQSVAAVPVMPDSTHV